MARESTEVRGRAQVRPFRVGQVLDVTSADQVAGAITNLTTCWGGYFTPILDANQSAADLDIQARIFDVDALHCEFQGELVDELHRMGWLWGGLGELGPFAPSSSTSSSTRLRYSVLPAAAVAIESPSVVLVEWDPEDPLDLFYTALFGASASAVSAASDLDGDDAWYPDASALGLGFAMMHSEATAEDFGLLHRTRIGLAPRQLHYMDALTGVFIVRPDNPRDLVDFWNLRALGRPVVAMPADGPTEVLSFLARTHLPGTQVRSNEPEASVQSLGVWGLARASGRTRDAIEAMAASLGMVVEDHHSLLNNEVYPFPGLESRFRSSTRAEFPPESRSSVMRVPIVPLAAEIDALMPGIVAVEVDFHEVNGLDPRLAAGLPPHRRFAKLLHNHRMSHAEHVRVTADGAGLVVGVQASEDEVPITFAYALDAIHAFFADEAMTVSQSDVGRFQTRAAEMLGGPFGGLTVQPGVRAVLDKVSRSGAGLTLHQLKGELRQRRGQWPDDLFSFRSSVDNYVDATINQLLASGLLVPMLDVNCSHCRVESQVLPRDLDTAVRCGFCGESFQLALSLSLSRSRPTWRYQLAAHLGSEKVKALLPALATSSFFGQLAVGGPPRLHAYGVEFKFPDSMPIEADLVTYLAAPNYVVALGEVKNSNRIDEQDVRNLESLQLKLDALKMRSVLTFSSLKDRLAPEEVACLRGLVERGTTTRTAQGVYVPRLPLVLTAKELSLPWGHDDHPSRWKGARSGYGIFSIALESCKRNLGLLRASVASEGQGLVCQWGEDES